MARIKKKSQADSHYSQGNLLDACEQGQDQANAIDLGDLFAHQGEGDQRDLDNSFAAALKRQQEKKESQSMQVSDSANAINDTQAQTAASPKRSRKGTTTAKESVTSKEAKSTRKKKSTIMPPFDYPIDPVTNVICGVDEAGRGPLMGDVVAACVVLDHNNMIPGLNDSKKLTEKARDELAVLIKEKAIAWGIGRASPEEIDEFNILNATYIAMGRAYIAMKKRCNLALIDGNRIPKTLAEQGIVCETVVKGDSKVPEIAAASILAKTARDADMYELDKLFPQYHFAKHKGYPTAEHLEILQKLPLLDIYRMSFGPVKRILEQKATNPQY